MISLKELTNTRKMDQHACVKIATYGISNLFLIENFLNINIPKIENIKWKQLKLNSNTIWLEPNSN